MFFEFELIKKLELLKQEALLKSLCSIHKLNGYITGEIDISNIDFRHESHIHSLKKIINKYQISPNLIRLSLNEQKLSQSKKQTFKALNELSELGFKISIKYFASKLSFIYLETLPIESIQIPSQIIDNIKHSKHNTNAITAIIDLAKIYNTTVIAKGIDNSITFNKIIELGCNIGQGMYIEKPLPLELLLNKINK